MTTPHTSVFINLVNNGTGANESILKQKEHYNSLVKNYEQKGMKREAEIFSDVVEELATLQQRIFEKIQSQKALSKK